MTDYVLYDAAGKIVATMTGGDFELEHNVPAGIAALEGHVDIDSHFVQLTPTPVVAARQMISPTVSGATVSGLPNPCTVTIEGSVYTVTDGELTLSADLSGTYDVKLSAGPGYFDTTIQVTV